MIEARIPENEADRLDTLLSYNILDTVPEQAFDDLVRIATDICGTPTALVSLVDAERQWFKARNGLDATETPRSLAFCAHAILEPDDVFVVEDSHLDERFSDNPLVTEDPHVRFYAGAPLITPGGHAVGTLCVIDREPRCLEGNQIETLQALARQVVSQMELRKRNATLKSLSRKLLRSNEDLKEFTSIAAHDLREPLRKLVTFSDMLVEDLGTDLPERASEDLEFIVSASRRMQLLIDDLLRFSRSGSSELQVRPVELRRCVHTALEALSTQVEESGAIFEIDDLGTIDGDEALLNQLFQNLIANGMKFVRDEKPSIHVTCSRESGETVFGVRDNGIGIDPKYFQSVFAPFKRLHGRDAFDGSGIGLSICRRVVERHGGRIWVESTPGEGCHFKFTLSGVPHETRRLVPA